MQSKWGGLAGGERNPHPTAHECSLMPLWGPLPSAGRRHIQSAEKGGDGRYCPQTRSALPNDSCHHFLCSDLHNWVPLQNGTPAGARETHLTKAMSEPLCKCHQHMLPEGDHLIHEGQHRSAGNSAFHRAGAIKGQYHRLKCRHWVPAYLLGTVARGVHGQQMADGTQPKSMEP